MFLGKKTIYQKLNITFSQSFKHFAKYQPLISLTKTCKLEV